MNGVFDQVFNALSWRMPTQPQFQVGDVVIRTITVFMMNCLIRVKNAAKMFAHYYAMFERSAVSIWQRMFRTVNIYVSEDCFCWSTFPGSVFWPQSSSQLMAWNESKRMSFKDCFASRLFSDRRRLATSAFAQAARSLLWRRNIDATFPNPERCHFTVVAMNESSFFAFVSSWLKWLAAAAFALALFHATSIDQQRLQIGE